MLSLIKKSSKAFGPFLISSVLHFSAAAGLLYIAPSIMDQKDKIIEFSLSKPKPEPKPIPKQLTPPKPKPKPKQAPKPQAPEEPTAPPPNQPPPNADTPPPEEKPKPIFGLSMSSVIQGAAGNSGGFSVAVGNTLMKAPDKKLTALDKIQPLAYSKPKKKEFKPVAAYKLSRQAEVVKIVKLPFPEEVMKLNIEGAVIVRISIDETGRVVKAKVVKGVHPELDRLSVKALLQSEVKPAIKDGKAVATIINFRYNWELTD